MSAGAAVLAALGIGALMGLAGVNPVGHPIPFLGLLALIVWMVANARSGS